MGQCEAAETVPFARSNRKMDFFGVGVPKVTFMDEKINFRARKSSVGTRDGSEGGGGIGGVHEERVVK